MGLNIYSEKPSIVWVSKKEINDNRIDSSFYSAGLISNQQKMLKSHLEIKRLDEIIIKMSSPIGWEGIPSAAYVPKGEGIPLLRVSNIVNNEIDFDSIIDVLPSIYDKQKSIQASADDVIITRVGTIGRVCKVPSNLGKLAMGQNLTKVTVNKELVDPSYLIVYMNTDYCTNQMIRYAYGGVQSSLTNKNIRELLIPFPKKNIQYFIGDKIRKAEELREEARRLRQEAEEILNDSLQILGFKYKGTNWGFVPVQSVEPYFNAQFYNQKYLCFQEHLHKQNYKIVSLEKLLKNIIRNSSPDDELRVDNGIPCLIVSDIDPNSINIADSKIQVDREYYTNRMEQQILAGDVVYTTAGPPLGEACLIINEMLPLLNGTHVAVLRLDEKECLGGYLSLVLNSLVGKLEVEKHCYGIRQQYLFNEQLARFNIPLLDMSVQQIIHEKIKTTLRNQLLASQFIQEAKQDVEDLIEGRFDESSVHAEI